MKSTHVNKNISNLLWVVYVRLLEHLLNTYCRLMFYVAYGIFKLHVLLDRKSSAASEHSLRTENTFTLINVLQWTNQSVLNFI